MNKYVRKLFGVMFQSKQTQQIVRMQPQPLPTSPDEWRECWQAQGQPWRTQPEIDTERQEELKRCLTTEPDIEKGTYPFKGVKLSRADVEWLLWTHESAGRRGLVDCSDECQQEREGLDLRGAHLQEEDLSGLPLARIRGGLTLDEWKEGTTEEQREMAAVHLQEAFLREANLQAAFLSGANLQKAWLWGVNLQRANLVRANLQEADLSGANLQEAQLREANLQRANLVRADLLGANLVRANLQRAQLREANLQAAWLREAYLQEANLGEADLQRADLVRANLQEAQLWKADLLGANLVRANLQKAWLGGANLLGANLREAYLQEADLREAYLLYADLTRAQLKGANLEGVTLGNGEQVGPQLVDCQWSDVNLTVIEWSQVKILGDEFEAQQKRDNKGKTEEKQTRLSEYKKAVRANRQLAVALQGQGLNEDASRFAYRAQVLQRKVLWKQILNERTWHKLPNFWKWLGSAILALLAGYGYRMWRILVAYLIIVFVCAVAYFVLSIFYGPQMSPLDAVLTSITAFHGRVFYEPFIKPGEPQLWVTAFEAIAGLVIEGVFIAMLAQRFFGK